MKKQDFSFDLPEALIAHYPSEQRTGCRLMHLQGKTGQLAHREFTDLTELLKPGDLLVFNNTRVMPARLFGRKATGGRVEILIERLLSDDELLVQLGASKKTKEGAVIDILSKQGSVPIAKAYVLGREGSFYRLRVESGVPGDGEAELSLAQVLSAAGHMPLPPYIKRDSHDSDAESFDHERYQTVYAKHEGAVAAPTAGLHFDTALLAQLAALGIESSYVTLHVGAGTFQPVRVDDIREHQMHAEYVEVSEQTCQQIQACWARGGRVVAVGTTSVRCLETAAAQGRLAPFAGDSRLFIYPGYAFKCVDAMITNFHLSESTLIMMVSAFAGAQNVKSAYQQAIEERYAFFSYGDAMFIEGQKPAAFSLLGD